MADDFDLHAGDLTEIEQCAALDGQGATADQTLALVAEVRRLRAQQCPHRSRTFGQCIVCGWTGRPACSECGEPVPLDRECCSTCGAWENALEADRG